MELARRAVVRDNSVTFADLGFCGLLWVMELARAVGAWDSKLWSRTDFARAVDARDSTSSTGFVNIAVAGPALEEWSSPKRLAFGILAENCTIYDAVCDEACPSGHCSGHIAVDDRACLSGGSCDCDV